MAKTMASQQIVELSRRGAREIRRRIANAGDAPWAGWISAVYVNGGVSGFHPGYPVRDDGDVLRVVATLDNTASEETLARALVASAVTVEEVAAESLPAGVAKLVGGTPPYFSAWIGDRVQALDAGPGFSGLYPAESPDEARDALLDALFADETEGR